MAASDERKWTEEDLDGLHVLEPRDLFDPAILGVVERFGGVRFVLYSREKLIEAIAADDDGDGDQDPREAAMEHYGFNILGSWIGDDTPGFLVDDE